MRICNLCKIEKDLEEFHNCRSFPLGKTYTCKPCAKSKSVSWNKNNREKKSHTNKAHYEDNKDVYIQRAKNLGWARQNRERLRELRRERYYRQHGKSLSTTAARRALRHQATPRWADKEQIQRIYELCAKISKRTGVPHHVDHCIPLKGKYVCGLHVENNLQILPAKMNISKGNKYEIGY